MTDTLDQDHEWVARAREGDEAAFTLLIGRYKGPILNFVYRLIGDAAEAEDVAQETFVRAYRNLYRFKERGGRARPYWARQFLRRRLADILR